MCDISYTGQEIRAAGRTARAQLAEGASAEVRQIAEILGLDFDTKVEDYGFTIHEQIERVVLNQLDEYALWAPRDKAAAAEISETIFALAGQVYRFVKDVRDQEAKEAASQEAAPVTDDVPF